MFAGKVQTYRGQVDASLPNTAWIKIANLVREKSRVLELGCAGGHISGFLTSQKGCRVTGIELNSDTAAAAEENCETVIVGDVENGALDKVNGRFDAVIIADVLEHLRDPGAVLTNTISLLNEGGFVLISIPNVAHWEVRRDLLFGRFDYTDSGLMDKTHLRFFTGDSIRRLIADSGFEIEASDTTHRLPRHCRHASCDRRLHLLVTKAFPGLFGYQLIFKLRPKRRDASLPSPNAKEKQEQPWM